MEVQIPQHIAIIMDGNGRWAKKRSLPRSLGHLEGAKSLRSIVSYCAKIGVKYLTVYAFSTENWKRSESEVSHLMALFSKFIKSEKKTILDNDIKFFVSGRKNNVPENLIAEIENLQAISKENKKMVLNIAFNYGGRYEIIDAVNEIIKKGKNIIEEVDISKHLYNNFPDPDLVIRTAGEYRFSNFLTWQSIYSEFYVTETLWPDFNEEELDKAIQNFNLRDRKFGGIDEDENA